VLELLDLLPTWVTGLWEMVPPSYSFTKMENLKVV
jgi:hypothetical protein